MLKMKRNFDMFPLKRNKKIKNVSVIILTQNSEEYLAILLSFLTNFFSEIIVGVDKKSTRETFLVAEKYTPKLFWIENPAGFVENTIEQLVSHCSNDWVLRLDDDELISTQLINFIAKYLPTISVDAVGIHRKWCRLNLASSSLEYSPNPIYGFDWQWRLFRKSKVSFNTNIHTPGIIFHTETKAPLDAFIMHLDWVYRDYKYRKEKVDRYESASRGMGHTEYYLYEQDSASEAFFTPLYLSDFEDITHRLIPFQQKTNSLTTSFFSADLNNLNVSLVSKIDKLSMTPSEHLRIPIILTNHSANAFSSATPYQVNISYHWKSAESGDYIVFDGLRTHLQHPLHPGETMEQLVDISAPDRSGLYNLEITLVKENEYWFEHKNPVIPLIIPSEVTFPATLKDKIS
jgi:glycosyltransferase involved in cell wall biosynthesis